MFICLCLSVSLSLFLPLSPSKLSMVYHCFGCGSYYLQPLGKQVTGKKGLNTKYCCYCYS